MANKKQKKASLQYFKQCATAIERFSKDAKYFVFLHKNDLVINSPDYDTLHYQLKKESSRSHILSVKKDHVIIKSYLLYLCLQVRNKKTREKENYFEPPGSKIPMNQIGVIKGFFWEENVNNKKKLRKNGRKK